MGKNTLSTMASKVFLPEKVRTHIEAWCVSQEKLTMQEGVSKCAPSFFMYKAPTFTSRGFVIT